MDAVSAPETKSEAPSNAGAGSEPEATAELPRTESSASAPDLSALLPGWTPAPPQAAAATAGADPLTAAAAAIEALSAGTSLRGAPRADPPSKAQPQPVTHAAPDALLGNATSATTATDDSAAPDNTLASSGTTAPHAASQARSAVLDSAAASLTPPLPAQPAPVLATAPRAAEQASATAHLPAPIDSTAFAPTLATQVRWWAQDGVQQAQLKLNPADMGPVAVRIVVLDGREARIDFSADFAATRTAIEAALPVLAAALDESGLKLAGGGVHDGSAQRQAQWAHAQSVNGRTPTRGNELASEALTAANPGSQRAAGRGMVDLVA